MPNTAPLHNRHSDLARNFLQHGFFLLECALSVQMTADLKTALHLAIEREAPLRRASDDPLQVVCCPWYDTLFLEAARGTIFSGIDSLLGRDSIIYNYNNSSISPGAGNFSSHIHVERYYTTGSRLEGIGVMILLDDFTVDNGATWFLPDSWLLEVSPDPSDFFAHAERLIAPAGSVLFFHPHLWHSGGVNRTNDVRDALTIGFCRPYLKQRLDFPALFGERRPLLPDDVVQKLGFMAQPPGSIEEFYQRSGGWLTDSSAPLNKPPLP